MGYRFKYKLILIVLMSSALIACGGGGGGSDPNPNDPGGNGTINNPPGIPPNFDTTVINDDIADVAFQAVKVLQKLKQYYDINPIALGKGKDPGAGGPYQLDLQRCFTDGDGVLGTSILYHQGPGTYTVVFDNCFLNYREISSGQYTYLSGSFSSSNLTGSQTTSISQTVEYSNFEFDWESGKLTINGMVDFNAGKVENPSGLTIKHEDKTYFPGTLDPQFTDTEVLSADLTFTVADSSTPQGETSADITISTSRDNNNLRVQTLEPLIDLRHVPTAGVLQVSELDTTTHGIVTIVDHDEQDSSNWVEVDIDYDGDGSLNGTFDNQVLDWWQWDDFNFE